jgi:hypothetical protein
VARDPRRKGRPRRTPLTGPKYQFARELADESLRDFAQRGGGPCVLCGLRPSTALFGKALSEEQARRLGTEHCKVTMAHVGVCDPCSRRPDIQERLDATIGEMIRSPGAAPTYDLGDLPIPISYGA